MPTKVQHAEFVKNMDKLEKILDVPRAKKFDPADACKIYSQARPVLNGVLPILEKIPVVGKVVAAIRLLMVIADAFCKS